MHFSDENAHKSSSDILDGLTDDDKEKTLVAMFPALKTYDIIYTLQNYDGDIEKAIDELITQSFLEETGDRCKGIDGFADNDEIYTPRHWKTRRRRKKEASNTVNKNLNSLSPSEVKSSWEVCRKNVEFLSERLQIPKSQITSFYHETGASLSKTISRILETEFEELSNRIEDKSKVLAHVLQLNEEFPSVPMPEVRKICNLTNNNFSYAHEVLEAYTLLGSHHNSGGIQILFRHAPSDLELDKKTISPSKNHTLGRSPSFNGNEPKIASIAEEKVVSLREARNSAFEKATAAYRRGRSDRLMTAVATYYSEEGHNYNSQAKKAQSAAADLVAESQSSHNSIDLHGLSVQDAVRISRERVTTWWHELGEKTCLETTLRIQKNNSSCYHIVTGTGTHSKNKISRLGPAVAKMLMREGWKFHASDGMIIVTGLSQLHSKKKLVGY